MDKSTIDLIRIYHIKSRLYFIAIQFMSLEIQIRERERKRRGEKRTRARERHDRRQGRTEGAPPPVGDPRNRWRRSASVLLTWHSRFHKVSDRPWIRMKREIRSSVSWKERKWREVGNVSGTAALLEKGKTYFKNWSGNERTGQEPRVIQSICGQQRWERSALYFLVLRKNRGNFFTDFVVDDDGKR